MTTIATDGKTMAGDGNSYTKGTVAARATVKVERLNDGSLYGTCGDTGAGIMHRKWLEAQAPSGGECPKLDENFGFLLLKPNGELFQGGCDGIPCPIDAPFAIGSGMDYAIGAMDAGLPPQRAVEIASRRDAHTGGTITALELHPKAKLEAA